jgi:hypothetical protein
MFRLLQAIETEDLVHGIRRHFSDDQAGEVTMRGLRAIETYGVDPRSPLPALAARAASGDATIAPELRGIDHGTAQRGGQAPVSCRQGVLERLTHPAGTPDTARSKR